MRDTAFTLELNRLCVGDRFYQRAFISGLISRPIYQHHFENPWLIKGHFGLERISDQQHGSSDNLVRNKDDLSKTSCLDKESLKIILKRDMSTSSNLHWVDYAVIIGYFAVVIAVGIFSSIKVSITFTVKQVFTTWMVILQNGTCKRNPGSFKKQTCLSLDCFDNLRAVYWKNPKIYDWFIDWCHHLINIEWDNLSVTTSPLLFPPSFSPSEQERFCRWLLPCFP